MAEEISANVSLMTEIKAAIEENMPVYAECGGQVLRIIKAEGSVTQYADFYFFFGLVNLQNFFFRQRNPIR